MAIRGVSRLAVACEHALIEGPACSAWFIDLLLTALCRQVRIELPRRVKLIDAFIVTAKNPYVA